MRTLLIVILLLVILAGLLGTWLWVTYNALVRVRNEAQTAWAQVETETQRRLDLVPALVNTVQGYASHERETLERVIQARAQAAAAGPSAEGDASQDFLSAALGKLFALQEAYPNLKADQNFQDLQNQLSNVERQINLARRIYNEQVKIYNTKQQEFPANLVAKRFGHDEAQLFAAKTDADEPPTVSFGTRAGDV